MIEAKKSVIKFFNKDDMKEIKKSIKKNAKHREQRRDKSIKYARDQTNEFNNRVFRMLI
jgi:predicted solute-binding protein